ncbi:hypothetical protein QF037_004150 [Streptomyces canus]|uniref:hypothetical protein n=1 Tax=Streptomyces canus TaxID=58343 RepID=UPI0027844D28|nr:hypothetical protein [Streptomyces canus]MDQ0599805.1 hypothetical protein [Streptomyces canus]
MSDSDLTVDYEFLAESEKKLSQLKKTFEDIENRRDDMREHWGSGKIPRLRGDHRPVGRP